MARKENAMGWSRRAAALLATVTMLQSASALCAAREKFHEFEVAGWIGSAYANESGQLTHCVVAATYESGVLLGFVMNADRSFYMQLFDGRWNLPAGETFPVRLDLDGGPVGRPDAVAKTSRIVEIEIRDELFFEALKKGRQLDVRASKATFNFRLDGTGKALPALRGCVDRFAKPQPVANPFAGNPPAAPTGRNAATVRGGSGTQADDSVRKRDQEFAAKLLRLAGHRQYFFREASDAIVGWDGKDFFGDISVLKSDRKGSDFLAEVLVLFSRKCAGSFSSSTQPARIEIDFQLHPARAQCDSHTTSEVWISAIVAARLTEAPDSYVVFLETAVGDASDATLKAVAGFADAVEAALLTP